MTTATGNPTRRSLLSGRLYEDVHICSAVVSVLPARREALLHQLSGMRGVEVHHQAASKIVIVLEASDRGAIGSRLIEIAAMEGVLAANMVFEQSERLTESGEFS
jgi:nitrate reductase NapD